MLHFVHIQITRHNFVTNHRTSNKSGTAFTVGREVAVSANIRHVWNYFVSRNTLKSLAKIENASWISA